MRETVSEELRKQIGSRVREARDLAGFSQDKLAELIESSTQFISDLERGKVCMSIPKLIRICEVLHVSSDYILMGRKNNASTISSDNFTYLESHEKDLIDRSVKLLKEALSYKD